jgi:hypothetical protein
MSTDARDLVRVDELPVVQHALKSGDAPTIAASLKTVIAFQRQVLEYSDTIEPWWAATGWATIDVLTDTMIDAMPADPR